MYNMSCLHIPHIIDSDSDSEMKGEQHMLKIDYCTKY